MVLKCHLDKPKPCHDNWEQGELRNIMERGRGLHWKCPVCISSIAAYDKVTLHVSLSLPCLCVLLCKMSIGVSHNCLENPGPSMHLVNCVCRKNMNSPAPSPGLWPLCTLGESGDSMQGNQGDLAAPLPCKAILCTDSNDLIPLGWTSSRPPPGPGVLNETATALF